MPTYNQEVNFQFNVRVDNLTQIGQLTRNVNQLNQTVVQSGNRFGGAGRAANDLAKENTALAKSYRTLERGVKAFLTFELSRFFSEIVRGGIESQDALERLSDQLTALEGSVEAGASRFSALRRVAADLPATFNDVAFAANKLSILGLDASSDSIERFLDLSVGLGKPLEQIVEAFADAGAGFEFERLKELGIVAKQQTDSVIISFRGMEQEVAKTTEGVVGGLLEIGRTNFDGAAELQADNFTFALAELREEFDLFVRDNKTIRTATTGLAAGFRELSREARVAAGDGGVADLKKELEETLSTIQRFEQINANPGDSFLGGVRSFLGNNTRIASIAALTLEVEKYRQEIALLQATETNISDKIIDSANLPKLTEQSKAELRAFTTFVDGIERQIDRLSSQTERAQLDRLTGLSDADREKADTLIRSLEARRAEVEAAKEADKLYTSLQNQAQQASKAFQDSISIIENANFDVDIASNLNIAALEKFKNTLLTYIGPEVIRDGSDATVQLARDQVRRLNEVFALGAEGQAVVNQFQQDNQRRHLEELAKLTATAVSGNDPFTKAEQKLLEARRKYIGDSDTVTAEVAAALARYGETLTREAAKAFDFKIDSNGTAGEQIQQFTDQLNRLNVGTELLNNNAPSDKTIEAFEKLQQSFGLGTGTSSIEEKQRQIQQIIDFQKVAAADGLQSQESALNNERDLLAQRILLNREAQAEITAGFVAGNLTLERFQQASVRSIAVGFAGALRQATAGAEEQSRTIFELQKALDIGMAVNNYWTGITAAFAQGGPLGLINGFLATATVLTAISNIRNRQFGDTSGPGGGGASGGAGGLAQTQNNTDGQTGGDTIINVTVAGSILDEGGFQDAIVSGVREATKNNRVNFGNSTIRR